MKEMLQERWTPQEQDERERLLAAANACDRAADAVGTESEMAEIMKVLAHREQMQQALVVAEVSRYAQTSMRQEERLPLRDDGDDFGRIEARIPKKLFFGLLKQKNFGHDGFCSNEGMRDFAKQYPQFMVKTVSGKTTVSGFRAKRKCGVNFGRGTMTFAN